MGEAIAGLTLSTGFFRLDCRTINLLVRKSNVRTMQLFAMQLYQRIGFSVTGERINSVHFTD